MNGYDQLLPYLASDDLKFSSGAMRGTAHADWQLAIDLSDIPSLTMSLASAGFCAIEVDSEGFTTRTDPRGQFRRVLGSPVASSSDGVFTAFGLPAGTDAAASDRVLHPVVVALDAYDVEVSDDGAEVAQWVGPEVILRVANLGAEPVPIRVSMAVQPQGAEARTLTVEAPDGTEVARAGLPAGETASVTIDLVAEPGTAAYRVRTDGEPTRLLSPQITVSGRISNLTATTSSSALVASLQEQIRTGTVLP